jgi:2-polyprenyl-6-methoxyphenol hydroxylase-like FAD-dependent oxidoreductase
MRIVILGGGICGLGTALLLARDRHDVTLIERDASPLPATADAAWDDWGRKGVAQFRQPHNLMPGMRLLLESELPDVQEALARSGAGRFDMLNPLPPVFTDRAPRPIDDRLWTLTARRPVAEWVFARAAQTQPRLEIRGGLQVSGLLTGAAVAPGIPHVTGVRTASGETFTADLVVDAMGRQSHSPEWLAAIGAAPVYEEQADCGFFYFTRYFSGTPPQRRASTIAPVGTFSILTLPGDNGTWSVTIFCASNDEPLKALRDETRWMNTIRACPMHAHWLDGAPLTGVLTMGGIVDRYRRFAVDGTPVATGFLAVADAWACTNPSAGRGLTIGMMHARALRDVIRQTAGEPQALVDAFQETTERAFTPWYRAQLAVDRARFAEMDALREGRPVPESADPLWLQIRALLGTMIADPDLFRAALEYFATITPVQDLLARAEVQRGMQAAAERLRGVPPPKPAGPDRQQLLAMLA